MIGIMSGATREIRPVIIENTIITTPIIPKISNTLQILEPTTLPSDISPCPCNADDNEMRSSGDEVPIPTIVRPITNLDNLARCAIATDDSTK